MSQQVSSLALVVHVPRGFDCTIRTFASDKISANCARMSNVQYLLLVNLVFLKSHNITILFFMSFLFLGTWRR